MMTEDTASEALEAESPETEGAEEAVPSKDYNSFFIPKDILGDRSYEKGSKLTLQVMGTDEDGDLEVCFPGQGGDWREELKTELTNAKGK